MFNTAAAWIKEKLSEADGPTPYNLYMKGDTTTILYAEFATTLDRDTAVALIKSAKFDLNGNTVWASPDRHPLERAARNFCFGLKYFLKDTMHSTYTINVSNDAPYQVRVGGQLALTVTTDGTHLT
eukprot:1945061-Pyramimonas_sp.AAC.1